jgi:two-component system, cell cycle response regulator
MKQTPLKVMLVLDEGESSPYLDGGLFGEAYDRHLIDVKSVGVGTENRSEVLRKVVEQAPDVLLLDSTLAWQSVLRMAIGLRGQMPNLPIVLVPNTPGAAEEPEEPPASLAKRLPGSAGSAGDRIAGDSVARTIRYIQGRLGLQRALLQMALRDDLTGLHNRRGFVALATQHLRLARDTKQHVLLFFADLDGLKWINDSFGHAEGDRAISLAAASIRQTFRKFDVTGRLSGDEFVAMILEEPGRGAEAICQRLQTSLADCSRAEWRYKLSLSVGVAHFDPDKPVSLQELMSQADAALYRHKGDTDGSVRPALFPLGGSTRGRKTKTAAASSAGCSINQRGDIEQSQVRRSATADINRVKAMQIKRAERRMATNVTATLAAADEPSISDTVVLANISEHGACLIADRHWSAGRQVIVSDSLLNFKSEAEVVYCDPHVSRRFAIGLKFAAHTSANYS